MANQHVSNSFSNSFSNLPAQATHPILRGIFCPGTTAMSDEKDIELKVIEDTDPNLLQEDLEEISYKALPADLVDKVQVDVGEMKIGDVIKVKDLEIAKNPNIDLKTDPEAVVVSCTVVHNSVPEPETAEEA